MIIHCAPCDSDHDMTGAQMAGALQAYAAGDCQNISHATGVTYMCILQAGNAFPLTTAQREKNKKQRVEA